MTTPKIIGNEHTRLGITARVTEVENIGDEDADYIVLTIESNGVEAHGGGRETNRALDEAFTSLHNKLAPKRSVESMGFDWGWVYPDGLGAR